MRNLFIASLIAGVMLTPATTFARKEKKIDKKFEKQEVVIPDEKPVEEPKPVKVTNPQKQLYGEWTIISVKNKNIATPQRAYIHLDFDNGDKRNGNNYNKMYGNNGANIINGDFTLKGNEISFFNIIKGEQAANSRSTDDKR